MEGWLAGDRHRMDGGPGRPSPVSVYLLRFSAHRLSRNTENTQADTPSQRNLPSRGLFRPGPLIAAGSLLMLFGWYKLAGGIREQKYSLLHPSHHPPSHQADPPSSELAREKMWGRIHLIPLLQAEEDRDHVRRHLADQAREKELLGENVKVYHSDRCVCRSLSLLFLAGDVEAD